MSAPSGSRLYDKVRKSRFWGLVLFTGLLQTLFGIHSVVHPRTQIGPDALLFQYSGQVLRRGGLPYRDVWDIKPPVIHELAALLAIVSGGDPFILFVLSIILTSTIFVVIIALISDLTYAWTADRYAAVAAGLLPVLFPEFVTFASRGLRPKLFVIAFGLLSLRFYSQEKPFLSGILATLSAGLWQFGVFLSISHMLPHRAVQALAKARSDSNSRIYHHDDSRFTVPPYRDSRRDASTGNNCSSSHFGTDGIDSALFQRR